MISPVRSSDYRLLHRFAFDGDDAAFEELVRRHAGMARGVCRRVLGPAGDADDAAQTAFVSLAKHARPLALRLGPTGSLAGWLYRVAVNAALQQRRAAKARRRREATVVRERESWSDGVAASAENSELLTLLDEELKELPPRYRTPLVLCHLEGKTQHEAAELLGLSYGTLRRRLDRGRKLLKARVSRRGVLASSVFVALLGKAASAQAGATSDAFVHCVTTAAKGSPAAVSIVRPRVSSAGRVPSASQALAGGVSASLYSLVLATLLAAMAIPPMVSLIAATVHEVNTSGPTGTSPFSPNGSLNRSAV